MSQHPPPIPGWLFGLSGVIGIGLGNSRFFTDLIGSSLGDAIGIVAPLLAFLVGIWADIRAGVLRGKRIRGEYVWLRGAGEPFLDELPSFNSR